MNAFIVRALSYIASYPFSHWLDSYVLGLAWLVWSAMTPLLNEVRTQQCKSLFVVCCLLALLLSPSVFLLRCVSPSMIDVCPQDLTHLSPAACLTAVQWAQHRPTCMNTQLWTTWHKFLGGYVVFGESKGWCIAWIISPRWVYSSLCLFLFYRLGGDSRVTDQSRCWLRLIFATCIFVFESVLLFNICPTLYCHSQEQRNKKPLFNCRGCNSMLSKPIVLQRLHLFFSCIVYWACGSGRRLDRHNYAASQTSVTAFPFTWISVFLKPKVRIGWINMFILFSYGSQRFMQTLSSTALPVTYSCKYDEQVIYSQHWLSHSIVRVCLALGFYLFTAELAESFKQLPACVWKDICRSFFLGVTESFKMWMLYWKQVFCISA